jgi:hypothetical protein
MFMTQQQQRKTRPLRGLLFGVLYFVITAYLIMWLIAGIPMIGLIIIQHLNIKIALSIYLLVGITIGIMASKPKEEED